MLKFNFSKTLRGSSLLFLGLLLSFSSLLLSGCFKDDDGKQEEELIRQQEAFLKQLGVDTVLIKQHLADKGITTAKRTPSGLFYVQEVKGVGKAPVMGKSVNVKYALTSLEGTGLDNGTLSFVMGRNEVVPGFEEGISLMKVGGISQLYIPSGLGYGLDQRGSGIGPNKILVFHVELLAAQQ